MDVKTSEKGAEKFLRSSKRCLSRDTDGIYPSTVLRTSISDRLGMYAYTDTVYPLPPAGGMFKPLHRGKRQYELKNHLGNVMTVVSGHKTPVEDQGTVSHFLPQILHTADYSPFGVQLPERTYEGAGYRYGFNGQEKDDEIKGAGNSYTAQFWQYDSRLARRWNLDPVPQIFISDYAAFGNNPILNVDPNGAYFFGLFGSTSEQRNAANEFSKKVGGTVINKHSKEIVVSYTQQIGHKTHPIVLNRNQYFNKAGGLISDEGEIDVFVKNNVQEFKDYLDSDGSNWIESGAKFLGRGAYDGLDGVKVAVTSFALTQDVLGLDGPLGLDGNIVPPGELTDRGVQGYASGASFVSSFGAKALGALVTPSNYSSYANRSNWSRDVSRQSKTDQMRSIIFNADENSRAVRDLDIGKSAVDNGLQWDQEFKD